jgi:ADP-heptose:LPS heptosyltransferase
VQYRGFDLSMNSILVIAAAGLGPFVQMLGALTALRNHHRGDHIVLLTAPETMSFAAEAHVADDIWCDPRIAPWDIPGLLRFRRQLRARTFAKVYDLDGGATGKFLFHLLYGWPVNRAMRNALPWCGDIPGTADFQADGLRESVHISDRASAQLTRAGISSVSATDLTWVARQVTGFRAPFKMDKPFVLLACDPHEESTGWPVEHWGRLGQTLASEGLVPVMTGFKPAPDIRETLAEAAPATRDLVGHGVLTDMVFLAWAARGAVGCDNGLMHLYAAAGCRSVVLYDGVSDPARHGARGRDVRISRRGSLAEIPPSEVVAALRGK